MTAPSLLDELASEEKWLRQAAGEIASEGHNGWGNTCSQAADCIKRTHATIAGMAKRLEAAEMDAYISAPCQWTQDEHDGSWDTECGEKHQFIDGNAADNSHKYCPYCGGHLVDAATQEGEG